MANARPTDSPWPELGPDAERLFRRLPRQALLVEIVEKCLIGTVLIAAILFTQHWQPLVERGYDRWSGYVLAIAISWILIEVLIVTPMRFKTRRYAVLDNGLVEASGAMYVKYRRIAFANVYSSEIVEGPLMRRLGLARVRLIAGADPLSVGPLPVDEARRLGRLAAPQVRHAQ